MPCLSAGSVEILYKQLIKHFIHRIWAGSPHIELMLFRLHCLHDLLSPNLVCCVTVCLALYYIHSVVKK